MAFEQPAFMVGEFPANIDMSGVNNPISYPNLQFQAVDLVPNTTNDGVGGAAVAPPASAGVPALGILQNNPQLAEAAYVTVIGLTKAVCGSSDISINQLLSTDGSGNMTPATSGQYAMGKAVEAAAPGAVFTMLVLPYGKV